MSTQCSRDAADGRGGGLPDVVPVSLERTRRLSWELGERVTGTGDARCRGRWECVTAPWDLAVFDVGVHSAVVRVRTPVGRELFYETSASALEQALPMLATAPDWDRRD